MVSFFRTLHEYRVAKLNFQKGMFVNKNMLSLH